MKIITLTLQTPQNNPELELPSQNENATAPNFFSKFPPKHHYFGATPFWQTGHLKANGVTNFT